MAYLAAPATSCHHTGHVVGSTTCLIARDDCAAHEHRRAGCNDAERGAGGGKDCKKHRNEQRKSRGYLHTHTYRAAENALGEGIPVGRITRDAEGDR